MAACIGGTGLYKQLNQKIQKGLIYNSKNKNKWQKLRNKPNVTHSPQKASE